MHTYMHAYIYIYMYMVTPAPPMNPRLVMVIWSALTKTVLLALW